ncbi:hypothetical protein GJV76_05165 [Myroides sp. BIT-d1]|uniref:YchJ-like middle NTF2-like domain-containing protein n=1 Tax=Myroides albus TaxID=2562892 RepID=A0A6I3LGB8_9FLAO|nr:YchJ family metal-binding protein [Myroides albus]MTG97528.1 hypothetical protein [Myroides albus]
MTESKLCYCGSEMTYENCCGRFLSAKEKPTTAIELMRSRYSAYVLANAKYIIDTTHPKVRYQHSKKAILQWAKDNVWLKLEIVSSGESQVVFKAFFMDQQGVEHEHYENSLFEKLGDQWYYVSGTFKDEN